MKTVLGQPLGISHMTAYELALWLDEQYPHRCAFTGQSMEDIHRQAGARALVDSLLNRMKTEEDN